MAASTSQDNVLGSLYIHGMGHFHPDNIVDNAFLEELDIGTNEEWILERVGIHARRTVLPLDYIRETKNSDPRLGQEAAEIDSRQCAAAAADMALQRAGISRRQIGMVIAGGCYPDMAIPSEAARIAGHMGLSVPGIDINSACSTFGAQMHFLSSMSGLPPYILVVNPENTTPAINYADRSTAVLWGDGTSATVVSTDEPSRLRVRDTSIDADSTRWEAVCIPRFGHFQQDGNAVQRFAIKTTLACARTLQNEARERAEQRGGCLRFIGHQANLAMLQGVSSRLELGAGSHWYNVDQYGNTGAAGAPCVLSQHWDELADGDSVIMVVVGSGLTWSSLCIDVG